METGNDGAETALESTNDTEAAGIPVASVESILEAHRAEKAPAPAGGGADSPRPRRGRRPKTEGLSMTPEAIRARNRRAKGNGQPIPSSPPEAARLTPERFQSMSAAAAGQVGPSPEAQSRAVRHVSGFIKGVAILVGMFTRPVDMTVPDDDARQTAELIVEGWPELAETSSEDAAKWLAAGAVLGLVTERVRKIDSAKPVRVVERSIPERPPQTTDVVSPLPMSPMSL